MTCRFNIINFLLAKVKLGDSSSCLITNIMGGRINPISLLCSQSISIKQNIFHKYKTIFIKDWDYVGMRYNLTKENFPNAETIVYLDNGVGRYIGNFMSVKEKIIYEGHLVDSMNNLSIQFPYRDLSRVVTITKEENSSIVSNLNNIDRFDGFRLNSALGCKLEDELRNYADKNDIFLQFTDPRGISEHY